MTVLERIAGLWFAVLDASSRAAAALASRVSTARAVSVVEGDDDDLLVYPANGVGGSPLLRLAPPGPGDVPVSRLLRRSHATLELDPGRFIFRSIDLPGRAADFIEGILRTQIDRLTPWRPDQVAFGWSEPVAKPDGGIALIVGATDKASVIPVMERLQRMGAAVVVARVALPAEWQVAGTVDRTLVVSRSSAAAFAVTSWRRWLGIATGIVVLIVVASSLATQIATAHLAGVADDLDQETRTKRAVIAKAAAGSDPTADARRVVEQRKADAPVATLVLESVSRLVPDGSFVTSFEISGQRLRLVGFTNDAPALLRLLDGSGIVAGATFFAPTTRLPGDPGDRFSIEATLRPGAGLP